jgi:hypothetical protein
MLDYKNLDWGKAAEDVTTDYAKAKEKSNYTPKKTVDLTQYLSLNLPDNVNEGEVIFRVLPSQEDPMKFFIIKKYHNLKVGKNFVKLYDPAQDGEESPLNDAYHILRNGDSVDQDNAKKYRSGDYYIARGIQRGKEAEGVKFWRFNHVTNGAGIMDKLTPIIKRLETKGRGAGAIWNPIAGRDIVISLVKDKSKGKGKEYTKVASIQVEDPSPLSTDETQMEAWLNDSKTWKDVYSKKPIEYLRIVADGGTPVWSSELKKLVSQSDDESTNSTQSAGLHPPTQNIPAQTVNNTDLDEAEVMNMDDLPF